MVAGICFLLRSQLKDGLMQGAFPYQLAPADEMHSLSKASTVRIDYVQHAMSALMQFAELDNSAQFACPVV